IKYIYLIYINIKNEINKLKITRLDKYNDYFKLIYKLINKIQKLQKKPQIHLFLKEQGLLSLENIAFIYDWPHEDTKKRLNELKLKRIIKELTISSQKYWTY